MLTFAIILVTVLLPYYAAANYSSTAAEYNAHQHRILTNSETGTITHPLISHKTQLERRRRELHEKFGEDILGHIDTTLPPRPHVSRHSQLPNINEDIINHYLRSKSTTNNNHDDDDGEEKQQQQKQLNFDDEDERRKLQQQMGALYQGYGTHYVDVWVGSPIPQRQTVIVDTGSGVTAFPCEECHGCGNDGGNAYHTDNYFKESQSVTFRPLDCNECFRGYCATMDNTKKCKISMSYAEGSSWAAYEAMDLCYAGGPHDKALEMIGPMTNAEDITLDHIDPVDAYEFAFELAFGCQVSITGLFITQLADGIMGMENEKTSFWKQMHLKNAIPRPEFSLCFSRSNDADRDGTGAGAMTLGGVDPRLHMNPMVFARNVKPSGFYAVNLKAVYLREGGGVSAQTTKADMGRYHKLNLSSSQLNSGNVIVDSGTTDTYMNRAIGGPFKELYKELTGSTYSHSPLSLTPAEIDKLPTIILVMEGINLNVGDEATGDPNDIAGYAGDSGLSTDPKDVVLSIPASHYLEYDGDTGKYVPRFYTEEGSGSVLGANAMMGHDVYFDVARGRIGFAESDCDYATLLLKEGGISVPSPKVSTEEEEVVESAEPQPEETPVPTPDPTPVPTPAPTPLVTESPTPAPAPSHVIAEEEEIEQMEEEQAAEEQMAEIEEEEAEAYAAEHEEMTSTDDYDDSSNNESTPYELFDNNKPSQQGKHGGMGGGIEDMAYEILDDMKHECSSAGCRGIAALFIFAAVAIVIMGIRRAMSRRRMMRQYQEAELEISDLALDSDSDDEDGGYADEPRSHQIT